MVWCSVNVSLSETGISHYFIELNVIDTSNFALRIEINQVYTRSSY